MRARKINKPGSMMLLMVDPRDAIVTALTWISMVNLPKNVASSWAILVLPVDLTAVTWLPSFSNASSPINENLLFDLIIYRTLEIRF